MNPSASFRASLHPLRLVTRLPVCRLCTPRTYPAVNEQHRTGTRSSSGSRKASMQGTSVPITGRHDQTNAVGMTTSPCARHPPNSTPDCIQVGPESPPVLAYRVPLLLPSTLVVERCATNLRSLFQLSAPEEGLLVLAPTCHSGGRQSTPSRHRPDTES